MCFVECNFKKVICVGLACVVTVGVVVLVFGDPRQRGGGGGGAVTVSAVGHTCTVGRMFDAAARLEQ